jgi:hypothetical protein
MDECVVNRLQMCRATADRKAARHRHQPRCIVHTQTHPGVPEKLFSDAESDRWKRNYDSLRARLSTILMNNERQTGAIRARYDGLTPKMLLAAVTLLSPRRLAMEGR